MSVDLTLILSSELHDTMAWAPVRSVLMLPPSHNLYDRVVEEVETWPLPQGVAVEVDNAERSMDPYGTPLRWCHAGDLYLHLNARVRKERCQPGLPVRPRLAAAIEYLGTLPHDNVIILYWH